MILQRRRLNGLFAAAASLAILAMGAAWFAGGNRLPKLAGGGHLSGQQASDDQIGRPAREAKKATYAPDCVLVAFKPNAAYSSRFSVVDRLGLELDETAINPYFARLYISKEALASGVTVESTIAELLKDPSVRVAEPDYIQHAFQNTPNDPKYANLWGMNNTGQTGGTADADIDAPEAWALTTGSSSVIVAVVDSGVDYNHPDLTANILRNGSNQVIGYDYANNDNNPMDDAGHGTHCSGTIGGVGNNSVGVAGVNWTVRIMPMKFLGASGTGSTSNAILCIDFARNNGANVISNSWGGGGSSQLLLEAFQRADTAGIVQTVASGNDGLNIDSVPNYPASYNQFCANMIVVGATDASDNLAGFSNYGTTTVDIAAPGVSILSTVPTAVDNDGTADGYSYYDGTSMACPHVAGVAALVKAKFPSATAAQIKARILNGADIKTGLKMSIKKGRRLNAFNALDTDTTAPSAPTNLSAWKRSASALVMKMNATGDDGNTGSASSYEVRYSTSPITAGNFSSATEADSEVPVVTAGTQVQFTVPYLFPGDSYYIAVKAYDNVGNASDIVTAGPTTVLNGIFTDKVEGSNMFTAQAGSTWAVTTAQSFSSTHSWTDSPAGNYGNSANSSLTLTNAIAVTTPTYVQFAAKISLEANYDYLIVEKSTNGGAGWTSIGLLTGTVDWKQYNFLITDTNVNVLFRFRLVTDTSTVQDGVYLDNIRLVTAQQLFFDNVESTNKFTADSPWATQTADSFSPTHSWTDSPGANYGNNKDIKLTAIDPVAATNFATPVGSYWVKGALEPGYDFLYFEYSNDGGTTWNRIQGLTGTISAWGWASVNLPSLSAMDFKFRFRLVSDFVTVAAGMSIDDISWYGEPLQEVLGVSTVTLSPDTVVGGSGAAVTGTVTLSGAAPAGGTVVTLSSSDTNAATVPASVTVAAGTTSKSFSVSHKAVTMQKSPSFTATAGTSSKSGSLTVNPHALTNLTLSASAVAGGSGATVTGTVTLDAAAPTGGMVVALASSNTTAATVPATVTVAAGQTTGNFTITHFATSTAISTNIKATLYGVDKVQTLNVVPFGLDNVTVNPAIVTGGVNATGTVTLTGPAPAGGTVVALSHTQTVADMPTSVTVPAGSPSVDFTITTQAVTATVSVKVNAQLGTVKKQATLKVAFLKPTKVSIVPSTVLGGPETAVATVTMSSPAPAGGIDVAITDTRAATDVPSSLHINAGETQGSFTITTHEVDTDTISNVQATYNGKTAAAKITVKAAVFITFTINPNQAVGGITPNVTGYVTMNGKVVSATTVTVTSSNTAVAGPVSSNIKIPAGQSGTSFAIYTNPVSSFTSMTFTATIRGVSRSVTFKVTKS